jgi:spore coat protein A
VDGGFGPDAEPVVISRRRFLGGLGGVGGALLLGSAGCAGGLSGGQTAQLLPSRTPLPPRFVEPFAVPPVKSPSSRTAHETRYDIVQQPGVVSILPGLTTPVLGYDGLLPGPTLQTRRGERVVVTHHNRLPVPTVVHLHGGHTPPESDGYPIDLLLPTGGPSRAAHQHAGLGGDVTTGSRSYVYPSDQPAATLWYHDHRMDFSGPQVWRGLAGFQLVTDDVEAALTLPHGERDVPLMIMDRSFEADGSFRYPALDPSMQLTPGVTSGYRSGVLGDVVLVNGRPWPVMEVQAVRYRFRMLNASNARRYRLTLDPAPAATSSFVQVGSDGGLLAAPLGHDAVILAPAERFDVIVDFSRYPVGTTVTLSNTFGSGSTDAVMRFVVTRRAPEDSSVPDRLAVVPPLQPSADAVVRTWRFSRGTGSAQRHWLINDQPFDPRRMDAAPPLGRTEIWRFSSDLHHPVHIHLSPFQVLNRGTGGPGEYDHGWKDTVDLTPTETVTVAVRFDDYAGRYLIHCHNLEHEDMMMMAAFETVR